MASYYNILGSQTLSGTTSPDSWYLFTKDTNHLRPDIVFATFVWNTLLHNPDGSVFQLTGSNINGSTDLIMGKAHDSIYGSSGNDVVVYNNGGFGDGLGGFQGIQQMFLGAGDDLVDLTAHGSGGVNFSKDIKIYAGDGNDTIVSGAGADLIYGEAGNDTILGFAGADLIYGGLGNDRIYGDDLGQDGSSSHDTLYGQDGDDILYGGGRNDTLDGGIGNDSLYGGQGDDTLLGRSGNDILYGDDANNTGNDKLQGGDDDDQLFGMSGFDVLSGGAGVDFLDSGDGNDFVNGDAGNDSMVASAGNDTIDGGADIDTVLFTGRRADYLLQTNANGSVKLTDQRIGSPDGIDTMSNVEFFQFSDMLIDATHLSTPPTIISNGGGAFAAISSNENNLAAITFVQATDPDAGQTLSYRILGGDDAAFFTIDGATGALAFRSAPDFENAADRNADNIYDVVVAADDGAGGVGQQSLAVTILDVPDGNAPVIAGGPDLSIASDENVLAVSTVSASDPDNDPITYSIAGGADSARFAINSTTGALSFVAAPDFEAPTDANHDNVYQLTVSASDGTNAYWQNLTISVNNLNDNAPVLTSNGGGGSAAITLNENLSAVNTVSASDADGNPLTYAITGGDDSALFSIDANTGALSFIAAPDYETAADANHDNIYLVSVRASDGQATATQLLSVTIANLNDNAPVISSNGGGTTASIQMLENSTAVTTVTASDADGSALTYSITGGADASLFVINAATGGLSFAAAPDFEHPLDAGANNIYDVVIGVSDGASQASQAVSVTIGDVNETGTTLTGNGANNVFSPTAPVGSQTTAFDDTVYGLGGHDTIDGGAGADRMEGGVGNDIYYVDTFSDNGWAPDDDQVIEAAAAGTDQVFASTSYRLADNVENLTFTGTANVSGWGNDLANIIVGNAGANMLDAGIGNDRVSGGDGADTLIGGAGTDILLGEAGDDWLQGGAGSDSVDGGAGADRMEGGSENDTYFVDMWSNDGNSANDDTVIELAGGGADLVNASVTYTLTAEVEKLTLTGGAAINGTGNVLANVLTGNAADNFLFGLGGDDIANGGDGNDMVDGGDGNDTLTGGLGNDTLLGGLMVDILDGSAGDDRLDGGDSNDTLRGSAGLDTLIGGKGRDVMTGGSEADIFIFNFGDTSANAGSNDSITDFTAGIDDLDLSIFTGTPAPSQYAEATIATSAYADALSAAQTLAVNGVKSVFIAGATDGWAFWDGNGDGSIDQAVILTGLNTLAKFDYGDLV